MKRTFLSLVVIGLLAMPNAANATEAEGLLLYFPFEEGSGKEAVDVSGNGNNGTIEGSAKWVASLKNKFGTALQFNGSDVEIRAPHNPTGSSELYNHDVGES